MEGNGGYAVSWGGWEILHPITVGETLEADMRHIEDPDGLGAFSYQWLIDGIPIYGATSDTYVPKDTDTNRNISLQVSYLDDNKTLETVNTSTFLVVPNILATGSLTIDGDFAEGQRLMANTSAIEDEDGIGVFYYQWLKKR